MHKKFFISILGLTLLGILIFPQNELHACSCIPPPPPADEFENSDAVFMGTVTSFKIEDSDSHLKKAKIQVHTIWKGDKALASEVFTGLGDADCGFGFEVGETFLIYAHLSEDRLFTSICSRTSHVSMATEDLDFLNEVPPIFSGGNSGCCGGKVSSGDVILAGLILFFLNRKTRANFTKKDNDR